MINTSILPVSWFYVIFMAVLTFRGEDCFCLINEFFDYFHRRIHVSFHGTGDIFSSTAAGALVRGLSLEKALALAADYTVACIARTMESPDHVQYGVEFERMIPMLVERIKAE